MLGWIDYTHHINVCGVYALLREGRVMYVGKSTNLLGRINDHKRARWLVFDKVFVRLCPKAELDELERDMITAHKPPMNAGGYKPWPEVNDPTVRAGVSKLLAREIAYLIPDKGYSRVI